MEAHIKWVSIKYRWANLTHTFSLFSLLAKKISAPDIGDKYSKEHSVEVWSAVKEDLNEYHASGRVCKLLDDFWL